MIPKESIFGGNFRICFAVLKTDESHVVMLFDM